MHFHLVYGLSSVWITHFWDALFVVFSLVVTTAVAQSDASISSTTCSIIAVYYNQSFLQTLDFRSFWEKKSRLSWCLAFDILINSRHMRSQRETKQTANLHVFTLYMCLRCDFDSCPLLLNCFTCADI